MGRVRDHVGDSCGVRQAMKALRAKNPRVPSETQRETGAGRGGGGGVRL